MLLGGFNLGNWACTHDVSGVIQFFVVAESAVQIEISADKQTFISPPAAQAKHDQGTVDFNLKQLTLSSVVDFLYVNLHLVNNSRTDIGRVLR